MHYTTITLILTGLFIAMATPASAAEFDLSYSDANGDRFINVKNAIPFKYKTASVEHKIRYYSSEAGNVFNTNLNIDKDISKRWDMFFNVDYMNDDTLDIHNQVDYKFGSGYLFYNQHGHQHKFSYAVVLRADQFLNSLRYKYGFDGPKTAAKAIVFWIPEDEEVRGDFSIDFKVFKQMAFSIGYQYNTKGDTANYLTTMGIKLKYWQ